MNNYAVKDLFEFAKEVMQQMFMTSLDVDSLFTNVVLDETIKICTDELFKTIYGLNEKQMFEILLLTTTESIILFGIKY